jgi:hypothetical protein
VEVDDMDTMDEHFHPMNHRPDVEGMYTVDEHFPLDEPPTRGGWYGYGGYWYEEDRAAELEVVERELEGMMLMRH